MQLQERLEQFGVTNFPEPKKMYITRSASFLESLRIFYYGIISSVRCPEDNLRVMPTGRIMIEAQITDLKHGNYKGFKTVEGKCGGCDNRYAVAGMSLIGVTDPEELRREGMLLRHIDVALRFLSIPKGEVYRL